MAKDFSSVLKSSGIKVAYEGTMLFGLEKTYDEATYKELENIKNNSRGELNVSKRLQRKITN